MPSGREVVVTCTKTGILLLAACSPGQDAPRVEIATPFQAESATCPDCRIELESVVTLGSSDGPGALSRIPGSISIDGRGRFFVAPLGGEMPIVYSSAGEYLGSIGRPGEGPGQMVRPRSIFIGPADSVHVFDSNLGRISVFSPDLTYVRAYSMTWPQADMVMLPAGTLVINGPIQTSDRIGFALHALNADGDLSVSFEEYRVGARDAVWRRTLAVGPSGLWSIPYGHEHALRLFDPESGDKLREILRESEWYPSIEQWRPANPDHRPDPVIEGAWEDKGGIVWTAGWVHAPDWADHLKRAVNTGEGTMYAFDRNQGYDGVIEAVDSETGELVASVRTNAPPWRVVEPGLIAFFREDSIGWWYADLYRVRLHR